MRIQISFIMMSNILAIQMVIGALGAGRSYISKS